MSLNKKCKPLSLGTIYTYELGSNGMTMLELCWWRWKVEGKWLFLAWVYLKWDACRVVSIVYKGVEVIIVNENVKSYVFLRERGKILKHWIKGNKESLFLNLFLSLMWFKSILIIFLRMHYMAEPYAVCMRSLILYIYIYIYILFVDPCDAWK